MKFTATCALFTLAFVAALVIDSSNANNVTWGILGPYSRLVENRPIRVESGILRVKDELVEYPAKNVINYFNITAIRVIDHKKENGGTATLINGGPYYSYATIALESARGHGLHYTIQYYYY